MKNFFLALFIIFSLQAFTKADDLKDFEIEGMSVGDSLLDHISEKEILDNKLNYPYSSDKYYATSIENSKFLKLYDSIEIYLKKNDNKYIIYSIDAAQFYESKDKCLKDMDNITRDISEIFTTQIRDKKLKLKNRGDPSGKSIYYRTDWEINNEDLVSIECYFWSNEIKDKYNYGDHIRISATSAVINNWLYYEALK